MVNLSKLIVKYFVIIDYAVKCGDIIRIEHALTKRNLHS
jgi:hypothetical protein